MGQNSRQINHLSLFLSLKSVQLERNRLSRSFCPGFIFLSAVVTKIRNLLVATSRSGLACCLEER